MKSIKAVIFDMDGVIVDSEPEYQRVELELMERFNIPYGVSDLRRFTGVNPILMWREIKEKLPNIELTAEELYVHETNMMRDYYRGDHVRAIKPALKLIRHIYESGYKMGVASSSERENVCWVLERLKISHCFSAVVTNNDVSRCKPSPDIYCLASKLLGVEPRECVAIEDSAAGVASARAAGMYVIWYTSEYAAHEDKAVCVVNDLAMVSMSTLGKMHKSRTTITL